MSKEADLLVAYEDSVARLVAHASLHAPHNHEHLTREEILRGTRSICDRCKHLREALAHAAKAWRTAHSRRKTSETDATARQLVAEIERLGLAG